MAKILKNNTNPAVNIDVSEIGTSILPTENYVIDPVEYLYWSKPETITELTPYINSGDIVVNDGLHDLSPVDGIRYLKYADYAFNQRFLSEPDRNNGFTAKNVQEAIEESKANIEGKTTALPSFMNNGITKNKWLALDGSMSVSNELPAVVAFNSTIASLVYINKNNDSDIDIELYKNGALEFTWEIRNKRWSYKTNGLSTVTFAAGDQISCFAKKVIGGTGVDPNSVILDVVVRSTSSITGEDGSSTL